MIVLKNERCSILVTNIFNLDYKYLLEEFGEEKTNSNHSAGEG